MRTDTTVMRLLALAMAMISVVAVADDRSQQHPNIVLILADDIGTEVIGAYGGESYATPNIDALAASGMRFDHAYSAPVCSPSRVKLMTGRYGFRTGQTWGHIPADETTFGHILQDAGYEVVLSGKWQMTLLKDDPQHIAKMGFDDSLVFGWHEGPRYYEPMIYQNGVVKDDYKGAYGPDVFNDYLISFIRENKDKRFFAYYPMVLAHDVSNDLETPPPAGPKGRYETFRENVEYSDMLVGKVVQALDELGLRETTLVMYLSDNGTPHSYVSEYRDGEYLKQPVYSMIDGQSIRGGKSYLTDQGTHVPFVASWPGTLEEGSSSDTLIDFSDFLPTIAALTGARMPADTVVDGRSFAPLLSGDAFQGRSWVYQEWEGAGWIRNRVWKLYFNGELFNMREDPFEKKPLLASDDNSDARKVREHLASELAGIREQAASGQD